MPNHMHGIVILHPTFTGDIGDENDGLSDHGDRHGNVTYGHVTSHGRASLRANDMERGNGNEHADDPGHANSNGPVADNNDHSKHPRLHRKPKSLSSFIARYKSSVTTRINNYIDSCMAEAPVYPETHGRVSLREKYNKSNRLWQPNFYDHVIRNDKEYLRIKEYIQDNPKWKDDRFYK